MKDTSKIKDAGVTLRAVLIAVLLIPINNYWITVMEVRWKAMDGTCLPLFVTPIFLLFLIALPNVLLRMKHPYIALKRGELITIYMMIVMGTTLASHDLIQNLFGAIGYPHYMADDTNQYRQLFFRFLPANLFISDKVALNGLFRGFTDPWTWDIISVWVVPLTAWGIFVIVLIGMMMCLNIIIRKQWTENEKLVFPLIQLPIAMAAEDSGHKFYANKLMWAGFGVAFIIGVINGLHVLYPAMPSIPGIKPYDLAAGLTAKPWNALGVGGNGLKLAAYPFAIGLGYFMPLDLSFSCWFFYVARKLWQVFGAVMGWESKGNTGFPFYDAQSCGAWLALGVLIIIGCLPYVRKIWKQAWYQSETAKDQEEATWYRRWLNGFSLAALLLTITSILLLKYTGKQAGAKWWILLFAVGGIPWVLSILRQIWSPKGLLEAQIDAKLYQSAFYGLVLGTVFLLGFSAWIGLAAIMGLIFFGIYFILAITITRVRAELGTPHEIYFVNPQMIMVSIFGANIIGPANLTLISAMYWFNRGYRSHPMPNILESFKMAEGTAIKTKPMIFALMLAVIVGLFTSYYANINVTYFAGGQAKCMAYKDFVGTESFTRLTDWMRNNQLPNWTNIWYMGVGAVIVAILSLLRGAFVGWPFHPAGYALAISYAMDYFWFAFFASWLIKLIIVRYGGMKLHNTLVPFFLGLILGDFFIGSIWAIIGQLLSTQGYKVFI